MKTIDDTPIGRPLHLLSVGVWAGSLMSLPCTLLVGISGFGVGLIILFAGLIVTGLWAQSFGNQMTMPDYKGQRDLLDRIVPRTCLGGLILAGIAFLSLMICGSPAIIDGAYATMDHGQPVLAIGRLLYLYLTCCERLLFPCGLIAFASLLLVRTHTLYRVQHPSASEQGTSPQS